MRIKTFIDEESKFLTKQLIVTASHHKTKTSTCDTSQRLYSYTSYPLKQCPMLRFQVNGIWFNNTDHRQHL